MESLVEQIGAYIKDPAWWFSAFFIAIVASIIAGFAKDKLEALFGRFFANYKDRQFSAQESRERTLVALDTNDSFMTITMVRATGFLVLQFSTIILFLLSPMWPEIMKALCTAVPDSTCDLGPRWKHIAVLSSIGFGSLATLVSFRSTRFIRITMLGYKRYRRSRKLPPIR
jgi:hypothetical protein